MDPTLPQNDSPRPLGMLAEFADPEALKEAAAAARRAGYTRFEAYSPIPIHGLDAAMGRRRTRLPALVLLGGIAGGAGAILLQWWTNAVDYPLLISGKPLFSLPANIPMAFELVILLAALAAFGGGLALAGLPRLFHPLDGSARFRRVTTNAYFLTIEANDPRFDLAETSTWLHQAGASSVETYEGPASPEKVPPVLVASLVVVIAIALIPPLWIAKIRYTRSTTPRVHPVTDMDFQPKYLPQQASPLFADGRAMRPPVPGTLPVEVPEDYPALEEGNRDGKPLVTIPLPVTTALMDRGRQRYDIFCATCHGLSGDGDGITSQLAFQRGEPKWVRPTSLSIETIREQPDGQLFSTISDGIRTMPGYASQIAAEDRWAIVLYVRALQRSREATLDDVPPERREHLQSTEEKNANDSADKK